MQAKIRNCPDCATEMKPVRLLDATTTQLDTEGAEHVDLQYAAMDAHIERAWGQTFVPSAGRVTAQMCPECGRLVLVGVPNEPRP